ncbi:MAG: hypothetical protein FJX78_07915 [Armatimonadetes bacterium]|nr:hypothetical protein [Armatimonadota bacterium]
MMAERGPDSALSARIERLETESRQLRRLCVGLIACIGFAAGTLVAQSKLHAQAKGPRIGEAERFVLRDAQGRMRATLEVADGDMPVLRMYDAAGTIRTSLHYSPQSSALNFLDDSGRPVSSFWHAHQPGIRGGGLFISDGAGRLRIQARVSEEAGPAIVINSQEPGRNPLFSAP